MMNDLGHVVEDIMKSKVLGKENNNNKKGVG